MGFYTEHRVRKTFPCVDANCRTDQSFENQENKEQHNDTSCLMQVDIGMVSQFPLDYMHLIIMDLIIKMK